MKRRRLLMPLGFAASVVMVGAAAPGFAADAESDSDTAEIITQVAPEVLSDAVATSTVSGSLVAAGGESRTTFPASTSDTVVFETDGNVVEITLPASDTAGAAQVTDGLVSYDNQDGTSTVPVAKEDGSLQFTTIIDDAGAPETYSYGLALPEGYELLASDQGEGIAIASTDATDLLGVFAAPWAVDADGRNVPTHYEIQGDALVQIIDHASGSFTYPIVADPWLGVDLYGSPYLTTWNGVFKVNVTPTQQGKDWAGIATWWAHADEIKNKLAAKYPSRPASQRWNDNVQEQLYCHIAGLPLSLPEYNLEGARVFKYWEAQVAYKCNYPEGYFSG